MTFHEIGGLCLFGLFIIHKCLNGKWIKAVTPKVFKNGTKSQLRIAWTVDLLLLIAMTGMIVTGLLISKTLPTAVPSLMWLKPWHFFAAALAMILTGIHLGLHWNYIRGTMKKNRFLQQEIFKPVGVAVLTLALAWGSYSLVTGSFIKWISGPFSVPGNGVIAMQDGNFNKGMTEDEMWQPRGGQNRGDGQIMEGREWHNGEGKGNPKMSQGIGILGIIGTLGTYGSEMIVFAALTAVFASLKRSKNKSGIPS